MFKRPMQLLVGMAFFGMMSVFCYFATLGFANNLIAPEIISPTWLNSEPIKMEDLRGKVVLVEFWTFGCWNCRNIEPYVKEWHQKYAKDGLVVIAVHSPEFSHEKEVDKVRAYMKKKISPMPSPSIMSFAIGGNIAIATGLHCT